MTDGFSIFALLNVVAWIFAVLLAHYAGRRIGQAAGINRARGFVLEALEASSTDDTRLALLLLLRRLENPEQNDEDDDDEGGQRIPEAHGLEPSTFPL